MDSSADHRQAGDKALLGRVSGRVQGVGFRWFVREQARRLGIRGDVRNLLDGRVEFRCRGPRADVERFLAAVRQGPPGSRVDGMETEPLEGEADIGEGDTFAIRR